MRSGSRHLLIAAVHRGELATAPAADTITLSRAVAYEQGWQVDVEEFVDQPPLTTDIPRWLLIAARHRQRMLERTWRVHLRQETVWSRLAAAGGQAWDVLRIRCQPGYRAHLERTLQVQEFITAKHRAAMASFLKAGGEWLLILESDATVLHNSRTDLTAVLGWLPAPGQWFIDLAGGMVEVSARQRTAGAVPGTPLQILDPPSTNTACAYLVSRPMAEAFLATYQADPDNRRFAIDWVWNLVLMSTGRRSQEPMLCLRADPPTFAHGSFTGRTRSWQDGRDLV